MTPTEDDVRLAKAWVACQEPPVTVRHIVDYPNRWRIECDLMPYWLGDLSDDWYKTEEAAWSALATALKPVIASVRPVIAAETLERLGTLADAAVTACEATTLNVRPGQCLKLFAALHLRKGTP